MSLNIDKNGRVAFKGNVDFRFRTYPDFLALDEQLLGSLLSDCKTAMTARHTCDSSSGLSEGQTFFVSASEAPRCALEAMAKAIFDFHTSGLQDFCTSSSGAEWWTQYVDERDDIGFHFDRDYGLEEKGFCIHPHLATVTYLVGFGAPTLVLDLVSPLNYGAPISGTCERACTFGCLQAL